MLATVAAHSMHTTYLWNNTVYIKCSEFYRLQVQSMLEHVIAPCVEPPYQCAVVPLLLYVLPGLALKPRIVLCSGWKGMWIKRHRWWTLAVEMVHCS